MSAGHGLFVMYILHTALIHRYLNGSIVSTLDLYYLIYYFGNLRKQRLQHLEESNEVVTVRHLEIDSVCLEHQNEKVACCGITILVYEHSFRHSCKDKQQNNQG